jgi:transposase InsO family protein
VGEGRFLYLATVLDLHSKRLAGWSIADHVRTGLMVDALRAAAGTRGGNLRGAIFHSDNGAQSFNAGLKRETLKGAKRWPGPRAARLDVSRWVTRYNTRRRHSALGQQSPVSYEQRSTTLTRVA